jgi:mannose-6-phosphate isomerase-like protein (cupin superfamily)
MNGHLFTDVDTLRADLARGAGRYLEFLRVPDLSAGLYHLEAGAADRQSPHGEDEVYVVIRGRARFTAGGEEREVAPGAVLFVPAGLEHRFQDIRETLDVLVFFGPAEGSRR